MGSTSDVHVDEEWREIRMYYHGPHQSGGQKTTVALSQDGLHFESLTDIFGPSYFRVFRYGGYHYALSMRYARVRSWGGWFRSRDGLSGFEEGPEAPLPYMRHVAVGLDEVELRVFWSRVYDNPEHILCTRFQLAPDWNDWKPIGRTVSAVKPELAYEGADCPAEPSSYGRAPQRVRQLRDPCLYREDGRTYLLYSVAGEHGIAIARLLD